MFHRFPIPTKKQNKDVLLMTNLISHFISLGNSGQK